MDLTDANSNAHSWLEKYRPQTFEEIVGNEETIARLSAFVKTGNMPNLILVASGPSGVGKTTAILCLACILLGKQLKDAALELNASDDRGIDVVRNKIKQFAQQKISLTSGKHKIIILHEADIMAEEAQQALGRTMDLYSHTTRFALTCNTSERIIPLVQSRCAVARFGKLSDEQLLGKLSTVCAMENISASVEGLQAIVFTAHGDLRQGLSNLQATLCVFDETFTPDNVFKVCEEPSPLAAQQMLEHCVAGDIEGAYKIMSHLWKRGYSAEDILSNLFRVCKNAAFSETVKLQFIKHIGATHMRAAEGVGTLVQLTGLVATLCSMHKK